MDYIKSVIDFEQGPAFNDALFALPNIFSTMLLILYYYGIQGTEASALFAIILGSFLIVLIRYRSSVRARHYAVLTSINLLISGILVL